MYEIYWNCKKFCLSCILFLDVLRTFINISTLNINNYHFATLQVILFVIYIISYS